MTKSEIKGNFLTDQILTDAQADKPTKMTLVASANFQEKVTDQNNKSKSQLFDITATLRLKGEKKGIHQLLERLKLRAPGQMIPFILQENPQTDLDEYIGEEEDK